MKLTKQLITRFENPDIAVRTINGSYKVAEATVEYSNGKKYRVVVSRAHPLMVSQLTNQERKFHYPESANSWTVEEVPEELEHVADKLYNLAETSDQEAVEMFQQYRHAMQEFERNFLGFR